MEIDTADASLPSLPSSPSPSPAPPSSSSSSSPSPITGRPTRASKRLSGEQSNSSATDLTQGEEVEQFSSSGRRIRAIVKSAKEPAVSPKTSRPPSSGSTGRRSKGKNSNVVQRLRITTSVEVNRIPYIYDEILKRLPIEVKDQVDVFELQGLIVATSLDDDLFKDSQDPESSMVEHILGLVKKDDTYLKDPNSTRRRVMDSKFMTEKQADEEALLRYNDYINSPANQRLLSYRTDSATRHIWTEGDVKRFFEAFKIYGNGPTSNRQIAKYIGSSVHPNHVAHFKQQLRKKQKEEQKLAQPKKTSKSKKAAGGRRKKKVEEDYDDEESENEAGDEEQEEQEGSVSEATETENDNKIEVEP